MGDIRSVSSVVGGVSRRGAMQRLGVAGAAAVLLGHSASARAHDSTPAAGAGVVPVEPFPGVTAVVYGSGESSRSPGNTLYAVVFTFQPGAEALPHGHPGTVLISVSSGTLGWTLVSGAATLTRGVASGSPSAPEAVTETGVELILEVGDSMFYDSDVIHTARGAGDAPSIVQVAFLLTTGEPLLMLAEDMEGMDMGTPGA
jgi:hypothetical protein